MQKCVCVGSIKIKMKKLENWKLKSWNFEKSWKSWKVEIESWKLEKWKLKS